MRHLLCQILKYIENSPSVNNSMVVFEYTDLGRHLRGNVTVCYGCAQLCPQSSFVMSVVKSPLYFEALKTWYVFAKIQTIQAEWRFIVCFLSLRLCRVPVIL